MSNTYVWRMKQKQIANLLGALSLELAARQVEAARQATGMGASAGAAVVTLGSTPDLTIRSLAIVLGLTHSVTVRLIDSLVAAGLAVRQRGEDRREVALSLTARGRTARAAILKERETILVRAVAALAPEARAGLGAALTDMLTALTGSRDHADHMCRLCDLDACPLDLCPVEQQAVRLCRV
jgi:DNA-binding MarR family transcriptional regulator